MLLSLAMFCSTGDVSVSVSGYAPVFIHINDCVYLYVSFLFSLLLFLCFSFGFWRSLFGDPGCPYGEGALGPGEARGGPGPCMDMHGWRTSIYIYIYIYIFLYI